MNGTCFPCHPCLQVYELRMEAVLAELALLKAQCGCDYSLTLISPARQVEVMTSGEQTDKLSWISGLPFAAGPAAHFPERVQTSTP